MHPRLLGAGDTKYGGSVVIDEGQQVTAPPEPLDNLL